MPRRTTEPTYLRLELVRYARDHGIKPAARQFSTTVKTVRKWLRRWEPGSLRGLADRSRAPLHPRHGITPAQRRRAVSLKRRLPSWGASRMKRDFSLALSGKALLRIWREEGLLKKKRRKHKTKQCLREVKKAWRLFEQTCVDTQDLCDIPELWAQAQALGEAGGEHVVYQRDEFAEGGVALALAEALVAEPLLDEVGDDVGAVGLSRRAAFDLAVEGLRKADAARWAFGLVGFAGGAQQGLAGGALWAHGLVLASVAAGGRARWFRAP
jgi:transposase